MGNYDLKMYPPKTFGEKLDYWIGNRPKYYRVSETGRMHGYNSSEVDLVWFEKFIQHYVHGGDEKVYHMMGVFGSKMFCKRHRFPHTIFFSGETVHTGKLLLEYDYYCLDRVDLSMTFDRVEAPNYLRFPQWIMWLFEPVLDKNYISNRVKEINEAKSTGKEEVIIICNHDGHKTRAPICDSLSDILSITYGGRWRNTTRDLWDKYNDDKIRYLHEFKFNICPENRNVKDYVTEKVFESFAGGTIPIYYGSNNEPEPGIVNPDAVLFWDLEHPENNEQVKSRIKELNESETSRQAFLSQVKLLPHTVDYVYDTLCELKKRLEEI
ncbi:glycosyltransferase family 10 domain-containing protein [Selenomonas ruminantium]|uniref:Glycosyltransferase family 10 (Fucosyltransferase) C-term n=1 Tax=Selenomonas ruminantium TaxID=971 RepID=A0A1I0XXK4_SELRU|nr:glycosyltransferase family 10 [Selenomonas ruminantium]SFB05752.1 Glycosyltransferase family 10 (fucosyltransferase) C-term [Selenomonas ruminantium]